MYNPHIEKNDHSLFFVVIVPYLSSIFKYSSEIVHVLPWLAAMLYIYMLAVRMRTNSW